MATRVIPIIAVLLIVAAITWQLFLPEAAGLANNGDFPKIIARESFAPASGNYDDNWIYFVRDYQFRPAQYWNAGVYSSELMLFQITAFLSRTYWHGALDIRAHGLWHLGIMLAGLVFGALAVSKLPRAGVICVSALSVAVFADIAYTAYINSFYMDAVAMCGVILCAGAGAYLVLCNGAGWRTILCYTAGLCFVVASKPQHSLLVIPGVAFLLVALRGRRGFGMDMLRTFAIVTSVVVSTVVWTELPDSYSTSGIAAFNTIFLKILPNSPDPQADLASLGLDAGMLKYSGTHAFSPESPCNDHRWTQAFQKKTGSASIARFWLRHPLRYARAAWSDLKEFIHSVRPQAPGNVQRSTGLPPETLLSSLTRWSVAKDALLTKAPTAYIVLFVVGLAVGVWRLMCDARSRSSCAYAAALLALSVAALFELLIATGFDAVETYRHFFLMHLIMDLLLIALLAGLWPVRTKSERA